MQVKTVEVAGIFTALHAMRNPMNSWEKSDSHNGYVGPNDKKIGEVADCVLQTNIHKLEARYPDGFDPDRSLHRADG